MWNSNTKLFIVDEANGCIWESTRTDSQGHRWGGGGGGDRLLAIGSTSTFPSSSGPIAEMRVTSPILGAVLKLQSMQNHIKQILQKHEVFYLFISLLQLKVLWPIKTFKGEFVGWMGSIC